MLQPSTGGHAKQREEVEELTAAFLAKGGSVSHIARGVSGYVREIPANKSQQQRGASNTASGGRAAAKLSICHAAEYLNMSQTELRKQVEATGTPKVELTKGGRWRFAVMDLDAYKASRVQ
jgi:hypothetical protein